MDEICEVQMSPDVIEQITSIASDVAVKKYQEQVSSQKKQLAKVKHRLTNDVLSSYRRVRRIMSSEMSFTAEEQSEIRWKFMEDLMGDGIRTPTPDKVIRDEENRMKENQYCIEEVNRALSLYGEEVRNAGNEERERAYRILRKKFIDGEETSMEKIAENEGISTKTAYKSLYKAIDIMSIYLTIYLQHIS